MKRVALVAFLFALPSAVFAATTQHYIVITAHPFDEAAQRMPEEDFQPRARAVAHMRAFHVINGFEAELTDAQVQRMIASGEVEDIEPVVERHALDDTITAGQQTTPWGIKAVFAQDVWPVTRGAALNGTGPIHVAIIDTGIDYNAPELKGVYKGGKNEITGTNDPLDDFGHGTHVAGIIAAADDGQGVVGVAPAVDIYAFKVLDQCGSGSSANVIHAIDDIIALKNQIGGNWVANLSLGSDTPSTAEQSAFQRGETAGIIFCAASGNSYDTNPVDGLAFPAGYPGVVSVGAVDDTLTVAPFSQRGAGLSVVAPGVAVLSTIVGAQLATNDGRSFAVMLAGALKSDGATPDPTICIAPPSFSGTFVDCKLGNPTDFPTSVKGKIALIQRGTLTFLQKVQNAQTAGATAVVLYDNKPPDPTFGGPGFAEDATTGKLPQLLPVVMLTQADGQALLATPNVSVSANFGKEGWALESGTSMATPHATGVMALAWAASVSSSATDVINAVEKTATDLGTPGVDTVYGNGLVNALGAAKQLNPAAFGSPATPPPSTGRQPGRRGH